MDTPPIEQMQQQLDELQQELLKLHPSTPRDNSPQTAAAAPLNPPFLGEAPPTQGLPGDHRPQQQQGQQQLAAPAGGLPGAAAADSWLQNPAGASPPADQERTQIPPPAAGPTPAAVDTTPAGLSTSPPTAPQHTPTSSRSHKAPSDNAHQASRSQSPVPAIAVAAAAAASDPFPAAAAVPAAGAVDNKPTSPTAVTSEKHIVATKDPAAPAAARASADMAISPAAIAALGVNGPQHNATTEPAADGTAQSNRPGQVTTTPEAATGEVLATPAGSAAPVAATHAVEPAAETNAADVASPPPPPAAAAAAAGGGGSGRKRGKKHPKQPPPGAKAQLKGVFWDRKTGRWRSQLGYHNKKIFMGYYNTPQEAAVAYDKKAVELHGMLAKTNFPIHNYVQLLPDGVSTLPTAEMAIPQGKKQQPDTPADPAAAAVAAADMSYESEGVAGISANGNTNLSEGQGAGGDSGLLSSDSQQQQQQYRHKYHACMDLEQLVPADARAGSNIDDGSSSVRMCIHVRGLKGSPANTMTNAQTVNAFIVAGGFLRGDWTVLGERRHSCP